MLHDEHPPPGSEIALLSAPLDHPAVIRELWPRLGTDGRRALRRCCAAMCAAVDAHAGCVEGQAESPVLSLDACARLVGTHTLTLRSMACLRGMLLGAVFPRLRSLRLHLVGEIGQNAQPCVRAPCMRAPCAMPGHGCMGGCYASTGWDGWHAHGNRMAPRAWSCVCHAVCAWGQGGRPPGPPLLLPPPPLSNTSCMLARAQGPAAAAAIESPTDYDAVAFFPRLQSLRLLLAEVRAWMHAHAPCAMLPDQGRVPGCQRCAGRMAGLHGALCMAARMA
jgi:hypothetical protein